MSLEKIITISGKPGLYQLVSQTRAGFVVNSLSDGKRMSISMRNNVSVLNEISIYTYEEEVPLRQVFLAISEKENGEETIDHKVSKEELQAFFKTILPNYDEERVYPSDIKKVIQWYNLLQKASLLDTLKEDSSEEEVAEA